MSVQRLELPAWDCWSLLGTKTIGRLVVIDQGCPIALPVNIRLIGSAEARRVVVRTSPGSLLGRYDGPASIEVDDIDEAARKAWSVLVRGTVHHITDHHGLPDPGPWITDDRTHWLVLDVASITGRRFTGRPSTDGYSVEWEIEAVT
jgi:hypothetical protein